MALKSWLESANDPDTDFPLENLPFGVFRRRDERHIGVAIGEKILDLHECHKGGLIDEPSCLAPSLNALMAKGRPTVLRARITELMQSERTRTEPHLVVAGSPEGGGPRGHHPCHHGAVRVAFDDAPNRHPDVA